MMRPAIAAALLLGATGAAAAPLAGRRYYLDAFVQEVDAGSFDPFDHWTAEPVSLYFTAEDAVTIAWGQETEACAVTRGDGGLVLTCGGSPRTLRWIERPDGKVETSLWEGERQLLAPLAKSFDDLVAAYDDAFRRRALPSLAGRWVSDVLSLEIEATGRAWWDGDDAVATVLECLDAPAGGAAHRTVCVEVERDGGVLLFQRQAGALVEVVYPEELHDGGRLVLPKNGLRLVRAERR